ncbi:hypothetical protein GIB67_031073 [Kingdonia uniflora]|uniref:Small auxin up regulated protein n=1 Tax=Kingdonia uniflora TaxID=39325 RepID=A0A7J7LCF6_9MAGN|nr:hypothetical protein GIB67_031073 [Kingdonia uniflora]
MFVPSSLSSAKEHKIQLKKGCITVRVGLEEGKFEKRAIPISYLEHPRFKRLLETAQDVYGFQSKGLIKLPCSIEEFNQLRSLIERDGSNLHGYHHQQPLKSLA